MSAQIIAIADKRVAAWVRICGECQSPYARDALTCYDEAFQAGLINELKRALEAMYGEWILR